MLARVRPIVLCNKQAKRFIYLKFYFCLTRCFFYDSLRQQCGSN